MNLPFWVEDKAKSLAFAPGSAVHERRQPYQPGRTFGLPVDRKNRRTRSARQPNRCFCMQPLPLWREKELSSKGIDRNRGSVFAKKKSSREVHA